MGEVVSNGGEKPKSAEDEERAKAEQELITKAERDMRPYPAPVDTKDRGVDDWEKDAIPSDLKIPEGRNYAVIRFPAEWTDAPHKGERSCVLWSITDKEEKLAYTLSMGDSNRVVDELAKRTIRAIDGVRVSAAATKDDDNRPGNVDTFWRDIGKCRSWILRFYNQTHSFSEAEKKRFFESCVVVRTAG
ncbi:MAG: hypothetical protein PVSMB8_02590 [Vulcanimicrobiaceae bacterium]